MNKQLVNENTIETTTSIEETKEIAKKHMAKYQKVYAALAGDKDAIITMNEKKGDCN